MFFHSGDKLLTMFSQYELNNLFLKYIEKYNLRVKKGEMSSILSKITNIRELHNTIKKSIEHAEKVLSTLEENGYIFKLASDLFNIIIKT